MFIRHLYAPGTGLGAWMTWLHLLLLETLRISIVTSLCKWKDWDSEGRSDSQEHTQPGFQVRLEWRIWDCFQITQGRALVGVRVTQIGHGFMVVGARPYVLLPRIVHIKSRMRQFPRSGLDDWALDSFECSSVARFHPGGEGLACPVCRRPS
jgi:hypothetical protein